MIRHLEIVPRQADTAVSSTDRRGQEAEELGIPGSWVVRETRGLLIEGNLTESAIAEAAQKALLDPVIETGVVRTLGAGGKASPASSNEHLVHVLPKPGVTDPPAETAADILKAMGYLVERVRTVKTYRIQGPGAFLADLVRRTLAN